MRLWLMILLAVIASASIWFGYSFFKNPSQETPQTMGSAEDNTKYQYTVPPSEHPKPANPPQSQPVQISQTTINMAPMESHQAHLVATPAPTTASTRPPVQRVRPVFVPVPFNPSLSSTHAVSPETVTPGIKAAAETRTAPAASANTVTKCGKTSQAMFANPTPQNQFDALASAANVCYQQHETVHGEWFAKNACTCAPSGTIIITKSDGTMYSCINHPTDAVVCNKSYTVLYQ